MTRYEMLDRYNDFVLDVSFSTMACHGISAWFDNINKDIINANGCFPGSDEYFKRMLMASYDHLKYLYAVNKRLEDAGNELRMTEGIEVMKHVIEDILNSAK